MVTHPCLVCVTIRTQGYSIAVTVPVTPIAPTTSSTGTRHTYTQGTYDYRMLREIIAPIRPFLGGARRPHPNSVGAGLPRRTYGLPAPWGYAIPRLALWAIAADSLAPPWALWVLVLLFFGGCARRGFGGVIVRRLLFATASCPRAPVGRVRASIMVLILSPGDNNHYRFPLPHVLQIRAGSLVPRSALRPDVASAPPNCGVPPPAALPAAAPSALKGTIVNRQ